MDEFCLDTSCFQNRKKAKYSCSCDSTLRFCSKHMLKHHKIPGVHNEIEVYVAIKELQLKAAYALVNLDKNQDKVLNIGNLMTKEILAKVQDTMKLLESRKIEILDILKFREFGEEIGLKIEEINKINIQSKGGFQESIQKYLELYENHENSIFKEEIILIHKSIEASNIIFKEINEIRSKENETFTKKFENLENKMNENMIIIKDYIQNEILIKTESEITKIKKELSIETKKAKDRENLINENIIKFK